MPFFSVIIPLYNKENFIEDTLKSVFNQDFHDFEIIIVNDYSTDNSLNKVKSLNNNKIQIIENEKNLGLSASRNVGIRESKGNYIAFIDADDLWEPFFLSEIFKMIQEFPQAKIFGTRYQEILSDQKVPIKINADLENKSPRVIDNFFEINIQQPIFCYSSVVFHKNVFENSGYFDENINLSEDIDYNIRSILNNAFYYSNRVCASYHLFSENQITTSNIVNKTIPDFKKYEKFCNDENQLKKFLDFHRYIFAVKYKRSNLTEKFHQLKKEIDYKNLTLKQRFLLDCPVSINIFLSGLKLFLLKFNIKLNSYN